MFMAFFGTVWADISIGGLRFSGAIWLLILAILIGTVLFFSGIRVIKNSRNLSHASKLRNTKNVDKWFNINLAAQFALIVMAVSVTDAVEHFDWFFTIIAIIVVCRFFPLAHLFQVSTYYVTGYIRCLLAIVTLLFVPKDMSISVHPLDAWWTWIGFGDMLILW